MPTAPTVKQVKAARLRAWKALIKAEALLQEYYHLHTKCEEDPFPNDASDAWWILDKIGEVDHRMSDADPNYQMP